MNAGGPSASLVTIVVPTKNARGLLPGLLACLRDQLLAPHEILVIDDGSDDDTATVASDGGARVLTAHGSGPYAARNTGWRAAGTPLVGFLDVRSRPLPTWLAAVAALLDDPAVALAGSQIQVLPGTSWASQVAGHEQPFSLRHFIDAPMHWPYLPTCNLITRVEVLRRLGGFRPVRSGGDADFGWRVHQAGLGTVAAVREPLLGWQPRTSLRALIEQFHRYGQSEAALRLHWAATGVQVPLPADRIRLAARAGAHTALTTVAWVARRRERFIREVLALQAVAHAVGYRRGLRDFHRTGDPFLPRDELEPVGS